MDLEKDDMNNDLPFDDDCAGSRYNVTVSRVSDNREVTWTGTNWTTATSLKEQYCLPKYEINITYSEDRFGEGFYRDL